MEPDWKQRLVNFRPEMVAVRDDANIIHLAQHLVADTVPWDTEQDFLENRLVFQKWKAEGNGNVLRTRLIWRVGKSSARAVRPSDMESTDVAVSRDKRSG